MLSDLNDTLLIARVVALGDKRAFDQLVRRHQSRVRRFFLAQTLGDGQLADDLAQDTFVKAYMGLSHFRGLSSFATWLMSIACRVLYDHTRRTRFTADIDSLSPGSERSFTPDTALRIDLYDALARLRPVERACISLQLIDGLPIERIAEVMSLPEGTVKSHLKRGKDKLSDYLVNNGYDKR